MAAAAGDSKSIAFSGLIIFNGKSVYTCSQCGSNVKPCNHVEQCDYSKSAVVELGGACICVAQRAVCSIAVNSESSVSNCRFAQLQLRLEEIVRDQCRRKCPRTFAVSTLTSLPWSRQSVAELKALHGIDGTVTQTTTAPALAPLSPPHAAGWRSMASASPPSPMSPLVSGYLPFRGSKCMSTCDGLDPVTSVCQCGAHFVKTDSAGIAVTHVSPL